MSWLFITLLHFPLGLYGANYPVTAVVFSLLGAGAPKSPPTPIEEQPSHFNLNRIQSEPETVHSVRQRACVELRSPHVSSALRKLRVKPAPNSLCGVPLYAQVLKLQDPNPS